MNHESEKNIERKPEVEARDAETKDEGRSSSSEPTDNYDKAQQSSSQQPQPSSSPDQPTTSTSSSTCFPPPHTPPQNLALILVPRSQRRGLLGRLTFIPEAVQPYDYGHGTKWAITLVVAVAASVGPMGSGIFYPALNQMAVDLNASTTVTNLAVAMYMLAMAVFPLWWSSFSEAFGRRTVYLSSFALFVVFNVLSAVSTNIGMLIAMRILGGGASASVQSVGAGTIADIWPPKERGKAMGIFYLGPLMGPFISPILGGALSQAFGWQSTMWFLTIYGGFILVAILLFLPETLPNRSTSPSTTTSSTPSGTPPTTFLRSILIDPLSSLLVLRIPAVAIVVCNAAITFGALFFVNISVQSAFSSPSHYYSYDELIVGLLYLGPSLGYIMAALVAGRWTDRIMERKAQKRALRKRENTEGGQVTREVTDEELKYLPEDRMRENAWIAAVAYPSALVFYGWTVQKGLFWLVPEIGLFVFGLASMIIFSASTTMLTEFVPKRSTAGVAVSNFVRNILSCVGAVAAQPLIDLIGHGWLFTALGIFTLLVGCVCIWAMQRWGPHWRKKMAVSS